MQHPFDIDGAELAALELEFEESLRDEDAAAIAGGLTMTTLALGEEGGHSYYPIPRKNNCPVLPIPYPSEPCSAPYDWPRPQLEVPVYTTLALGEEGGSPTLL